MHRQRNEQLDAIQHAEAPDTEGTNKIIIIMMNAFLEGAKIIPY